MGITYPLSGRITTFSSPVFLPSTRPPSILCNAGKTCFLKSRSDHAPSHPPETTHTRGWEPSPSARPADVVLPSLAPALQPQPVLLCFPGTSQSSRTVVPGAVALRSCTSPALCPDTVSSERREFLFPACGRRTCLFLEPSDILRHVNTSLHTKL